MSTPINLNKARKQRMRLKKKAQADENAVKFGRTKAQKQLEKAQDAQTQDRLSRHRIGSGNDTVSGGSDNRD